MNKGERFLLSLLREREGRRGGGEGGEGTMSVL